MKPGDIVIHLKTGVRYRVASVHHNYRNDEPEDFLSCTVMRFTEDGRVGGGGGPIDRFVVDESGTYDPALDFSKPNHLSWYVNGPNVDLS